MLCFSGVRNFLFGHARHQGIYFDRAFMIMMQTTMLLLLLIIITIMLMLLL
jgi:hypothetical protein